MSNPASETVTPPFTAFRFEVTLNLDEPPSGVTNPVCNAAFAECDGLEMSMEPKSYSQGGDNSQQVHLPGPATYSPLTLRRGMTTNIQLWSWLAYAAQPGHNARAQGVITLWNSDSSPALEFALKGCLPVKMRGPSMNASDGQVAIEELQLVYEVLEVRLPGRAGAGIGIGISIGASAGFSAGVSAGASVSGGPGLSASVSAGASFSIG